MATPEELKKQLEKFNDELTKIQEKITDAADTLGTDLVGSLTKATIAARRLSDPLKSASDITKKLNKLADDNEVLIIKRKVAEEKYVKSLKSSNKTLQEKTLAELKILSTELKINQSLEDQIRLLQTVAEEEKKVTDEKKKQKDLGEVLKNTLKDTFKPFTELLTVAGVFKAIIDGALRFSKISTDIGKNLGYGADKANDITSNMVDTANAANNVNITLANLGEATSQLSEFTGLVADYSADALETQVMLTKQFGLTGEEAAGIYKSSLLTGKSSKAVNDAMVGAFVATRNQLKVGVPFKATIAEAAKVSGQLAVNLQNNPALITKAVVQAKALGTTLEQVKNQGESLLNFESSLENELKAELLTGKQLNLERARAAALAGDQVALAEELNKNVGTLEDFQKMNVLQQKALAEAVGLTADQLSEQLRKQKMAQESGKSLAQITEEEAKQAEQRQATQEKFNQAILKLQDFFGNLVAGPLGTFLEMLTNALPLVKGIGVGLGVWWTLSKGIALYNLISSGALTAQLAKLPALLGFKTSEAAVETEGAVASITTASALSLGIGIASIIAGIVAGVSAMNSAKDAGDIFSPADGKTQISTKEGGLFNLSKNDDVLAGPGLASKVKNSESNSMGVSIDLTPMILAINEVRAAVNNLANRPVIVTMDSKQVGSSLVQSSPKSA